MNKADKEKEFWWCQKQIKLRFPSRPFREEFEKLWERLFTEDKLEAKRSNRRLTRAEWLFNILKDHENKTKEES